MISLILGAWRIWAPILAVIALYFAVSSYIDGVRDEGIKTGIARQAEVDKKEFDRRSLEREARILELETQTTLLANSLALKNVEAKGRAADVDKKLASLDGKFGVFQKDGKANTGCSSTEFYLGSDFSNVWNSYNKAIFQ